MESRRVNDWDKLAKEMARHGYETISRDRIACTRFCHKSLAEHSIVHIVDSYDPARLVYATVFLVKDAVVGYTDSWQKVRASLNTRWTNAMFYSSPATLCRLLAMLFKPARWSVITRIQDLRIQSSHTCRRKQG